MERVQRGCEMFREVKNRLIIGNRKVVVVVVGSCGCTRTERLAEGRLLIVIFYQVFFLNARNSAIENKK